MINISNFDPNLLKIDTKTYTDIDIYYIEYITIKSIHVYEDIYSVNSLYLTIGEADGHIEEKNGSKYLIFGSMDENKKIFKSYIRLLDMIKNEIEMISGGKKG